MRRVAAAVWVVGVALGMGARVAGAGPVLYYTDSSTGTAGGLEMLTRSVVEIPGVEALGIADWLTPAAGAGRVGRAFVSLAAAVAMGGPDAAFVTGGPEDTHDSAMPEARRNVLGRIFDTEVPEPGLASLLGLGFLALARQRIRGRHRAL